jgi:NADH:ubiquinone oxidoreductase subunit 6 (subunit J)
VFAEGDAVGCTRSPYAAHAALALFKLCLRQPCHDSPLCRQGRIGAVAPHVRYSAIPSFGMTAESDEASGETVHTGRGTYRYLRAGMVVVIVMLFAAIFIDSLPTDCWQGSISAYYYSAARNVLVATLCCLGIILIVYKGSNDTEDVLLNLAGTLAFFVAFVPIKLPEVAGCRQVLPTAEEKSDAITNNVGAVIVALAVAGAITALVYFVDKESRSDTSRWGNRLRVISGIVLAGFVIAYFCFPTQFEEAAHWAAAVLIFVLIGAVVFINAYLVSNQDKQDPATRERFRRRYRVIGWMMVGSVVGALIVALTGKLSDIEGEAWNIPVFALETALLLEFALFWAFQTFELWDHADRNTLISDEQQETLTPL